MVNIYMYITIRGPQKQSGAYGYILETIVQGKPVTLTKFGELSGVSENEAWMDALIDALGRMKKQVRLSIYADCRALAAGFEQGWIEKWKSNRWKNAKGEDIKHVEKWQQIEYLLNLAGFEFHVGVHHEYSDWLKRETEKENEKLKEKRAEETKHV